MKVTIADLKICLAAWQKHFDDSNQQWALIRAHRVGEADHLSIHIGELYALDIHSLDLLKGIFPDDSDLISKWLISEGAPSLGWYVNSAAYKIGALKLAIDILERRNTSEAGKD